MSNGKYVYKYAIIIEGLFMSGKVYTNTREEAYARLPYEMMIGMEKLNKAYPWEEHYFVDQKNLIGADGMVDTYQACADYDYPWISYKIRKVRVPV